MRLFIAVELSEEAWREVAALQADLRRAGADVKWVEPENLHLTLKFLGEIPEGRLPALKEALQQSTLHLSPFTPYHGNPALQYGEERESPKGDSPKPRASARGTGFTFSLEGVGAFPRIQRPRVIWVGVKEGALQLAGLAAAVEKSCSELGFPAGQRPFSSHLTIGRVRSGERLPALVEKLQGSSFQASTGVPVEHITLFQSTLSPHGPIYTALAKFPHST